MSPAWQIILTAVSTVVLTGILQYLFLFTRKKNSIASLRAEIAANREIMLHNRNRCQQMLHELTSNFCEASTATLSQPPTQIFYMLDKLLHVIHDPEMHTNEGMRRQFQQLMVQLKHQNSMIEELKFLFRDNDGGYTGSIMSMKILLTELLVFIDNDRIDALPEIFDRTINEMRKSYAPLLDDPIF